MGAEKGIPAFGLGWRRFSKEKIPGVEEEKPLPFLFHLGDKRGLLGDTAKRVSESPAGLDLAHHIVRIDDGKRVFEFSLRSRALGQHQD